MVGAVRYLYHPESDCFWTDDTGNLYETDGLVEELDRDTWHIAQGLPPPPPSPFADPAIWEPDTPTPPMAHPDAPHATIDWETYSHAGLFLTEDGKYVSMHGSTKASDKGLPGVGSAVYAQHPSTEILTLSYRVPGGPLKRWRPGLPLPHDLFDWVSRGGLIEAHNVMFERLIWHYVATPRHGFPPVPPSQWRCSMAKARVNALPGALGDLTAVLNTPIVKDADGKRLLDKFSVPHKPTKTDARLRIRPEDDPADAERLYGYCDVDVQSEELASAAMLPMTPAEIEFWQIDQEINWRGVGVDLEGVRACRVILEQVFEKYAGEFAEITGGLSPTQIQALVGWLSAKGVHTASLDADAIETLLAGDLPDDARRALEIRQLTGSASVKKLYSMERMATAEGRLCNLYAHHGARTGRPIGQDCQPTNLPKAGPRVRCCAGCGRWAGATLDLCPWCGVPRPPSAKPTGWDADAVEDVLEIMRSGSVDMVEMFYGDALLAISGCIRSLFVAAPGHDLIASDYSAIEAVTLAALAGEQWRLDTFHAGVDIYLAGASKITGRSVQFYLDYKRENGVHHPDRQKIGKVSELACLGGDTQVMVKVGHDGWEWRKITDVTAGDRVYDGEHWVRTDGAASMGDREVIHLSGVSITPDHKVLRFGEWQTAEHVAKHRADHPDDVRPYGPIPVYDLLNCGPRNRFTIRTDSGHLIVHNCGYQGWIGAYRAFGAEGTDDEIKAQILAWRAASPAIVEFWGGQGRGFPGSWDYRPELYGIEGAFIAAVQNPGLVTYARSLSFRYDPGGDYLHMTLPSGRYLTYHQPRLVPSQKRAGELSITYMTWNSNPKYGATGWICMNTWGGRLAENANQAVAHDIQRYGIINLRAAGYPTVLHVYDEDVVEVPEGFGSVEEVEDIMGRMPPWAEGWPIKASGGYRAKRYRKG